MNSFSFFKFSCSLIRNNLYTSITKIIFNALIYYIFIPTFMLNYLEFNYVEASLTRFFQNYIEIILFNSFLGLIFMTCLKVFQRGRDIGIMMAVGGKKFSCILLMGSEISVVLLISFLIGACLQYNYRIIDFNMEDFFVAASICFAISLTICLIFTFIITYLFTLTDPYKTIRKI